MKGGQLKLLTALLCCFTMVLGETDPQDIQVLNDFRKGLENPELLKWPSVGGDPCGPPLWPHIFCVGSRVSQIQVQNLGLKGPLPPNFNKLSKLSNLGFQHNNFSGPLPSFSGLSELQYAYLGSNQFDTIPSDFFDGLPKLQVMSLDYSPLNKTTGWSVPSSLQNSAQLMNLSLISCNLVGPLPEFLGTMASLTNLKLSYNNFMGNIPASYAGSQLQTLWLNNQDGDKLSGPIDVVASMTSMRSLWLHGNRFTGTIPASIVDCTSLTDLRLNNNQLVGPIPANLTSLPLENLQVDNNMLTGPIPKLGANFTHSGNSFCQAGPGTPCAPEVTALLDFLGGVNYPSNLASSWSGNDPCANWFGITCNGGKVSVINLPNHKLNGTLSPSVGKLDSIVSIMLEGNNLNGTIPTALTGLKTLRMLNLGSNNIEPPVPKFGSGVKLVTDGNPKLTGPSPGASPLPNSPSSPPGSSQSPTGNHSSSGGDSGHSRSPSPDTSEKGIKISKLVPIAVPVACVAGFALLVGAVMLVCWKKKRTIHAPSTFVVHPKDPSDPDNMLKIVVANNNDMSSNITASGSQSRNSSGTNEGHVIEVGNLIISVQVLRNVTRNFAPENELGRGGFGVVYKGELDDGTTIAVKRMEASVISNKALDEFQAEIAVLSKVRHRHLVSLLGYSIEGNERLLVYEYMPQGALSKHLFHWKSFKLEPLSWKRRLNIALDVARGMEYLHSLAHQSFIHRDLKSSNILLGDDYRAKVSDFGLVKLAPDGKQSVVTRLAGTFGYLAPEYAVTGKITTKADVFSYGVVLMELVTGLTALDEGRPEESRYLAEWFWHIKSSKEKLRAAIDPAIDVTEETLESISIISELAGHCTAREPSQRPDMGHAVNVLSPMVEKWKPTYDDQEEYLGIDCSQPLHQMVKVWQAADGADNSMTGLDDSKGSIPARPTGFAESFTSADGR